ncbi:MAG: alanyl-tRNA editing protein [Butyrivibrio sp.]|nr:alanyl-tRNA editing protein [Butyrivibrio sp.]
MVKTRELYYEDAYIKSFQAKVVSCSEGKKGGFEIILDETCFFPEEGGQTSDVGILKTADGRAVKVSHVSIREGIVIHETDEAAKEGDTVYGEIDWDHRFSNMQQHTGEHIFSGIVSSRFGFDNVGFHLSDSEVTMDYSGVLSPEDIHDIEMAVNRAIWENIPVKCEFPDADTLKDMPYRSKKELTGDVRIVTIPGYDMCACCAPHVARTGEIGILKVVGLQNYKGGVRVNILCGKRALEAICAEHDVVGSLMGMLTTSADRLVTSVQKQADENKSLKLKLSETEDRLIPYELAQIDPELSDVFLVKSGDTSQGTIKKIVNALVSGHDGYCGVFSGSDTEGYRYMIMTGSAGKDLKALQERLKNGFNARGGGNNAMIQGSIGAVKIQDIIEELGRD